MASGIPTGDDIECYIYTRWKNISTNPWILDIGYEGIPQNICINFFIAILLILIFSCIRKKAWNYGRIAFMQPAESDKDQDGQNTLIDVVTNQDIQVNGSHQVTGLKESAELADDLTQDGPVIDDSGFFSWILTTIRLSDEQIRIKSGPDAVYYLSFQRHLIFIGFVIMIVSIFIVLPINAHGNPESSLTQFKTMTIRNLTESDRKKLLWAHVSLTIVYLIVTIAVLRHFSRSLAFAERDPVMSRTIMISRIAKRNAQTDKLKRHFLEIYPEFEIDDISVAYNISRLQNAEVCRNAAVRARTHWENYYEETEKRPRMKPYTCGKLLCCCSRCGIKYSDAIDYYQKEEERHQKVVEVERNHALARPLGIAFVTFKSIDMAHRAVNDYNLSAKCLNQRPNSSFSRKLKSSLWFVKYAPLPEDLYWENLALSYEAWYFKAVLVNVVLFFLVLVYSTPVVILNVLNSSLGLRNKLSEWGAMSLTDTMPAVLLWITAVSLPSLVAVSDRAIGFWTKTTENRSRMVKSFSFLLLMVVILPSLGSESVISYFRGDKVKLKCIFYTGNSLFFLNYVITSSLVGTIAELMRVPELLCYAIKLCFAKSAAEASSIRESVLVEFDFGAQYTWTMLNFTIFAGFSLICPIVTPFGLLYTILKHHVDKYNVYFAYAPCKVEKEVHLTALNFVVITMFILQIIMLSYLNSVEDEDDSNKLLQVFSIFAFCITTAFFIGQIFFDMCTNFSPMSHGKMDSTDRYKMDEYVSSPGEPSTAPLEASDGASVSHAASTAENLKAAAAPKKAGDSSEHIGRYFPKILRNTAPPPQPEPALGSPGLLVNSSHSNNGSQEQQVANSAPTKKNRVHMADAQVSASGPPPTKV